ncbi:MAG: hypothetical protein AUK34_14480 [Ignavibacteria bacterium CG2_30_36_16]|nr:fluoride efflux transporter CrcB [Ignavibacteria bacterium]OIP54749.1 MAG: hypothetical protein AUK34_14480 [Ignavibacteria bacterium CG2_30_36_16]PJB00872.1 MAG: fluoride efflux transporter CrcB [Ignavibacteria bacterium CG_4_9_14_3_um_filter_36_18]
MNNIILASLGAAVGGGLRYWMSNAVYKFLPENFPYGTLTVNMLGSFLLGIIIFYFSEKELLSSEMRVLLTVGFCGGFTTFSTFSFETIALMRDSQFAAATINILLNVGLCLAGVFGAYLISKLFV